MVMRSFKAPISKSGLLCSVNNPSASVKQLKTMRNIEEKKSYIMYKLSQRTYCIGVIMSHPYLQYHHLR
jgi:hypothetical protein